VTDATILLPTHRHAELLPYAVRSALAQVDVEIELFVVGDGVANDTRMALEPFLGDRRVHFFDFPKGERHGERLRHEALRESTAPVVCYLCDDDLLLADHVATMSRLLEHANFAHGLPVVVQIDGSLRYQAFDLARPEFVELLLAGRPGFGLTGVAHTRESYDRLPVGWRPAPADTPTDVHMWRQFWSLPGLRGSTGTHVTSLVFPSPLRGHLTPAARAAELELWASRCADPGFPLELDRLAAEAARASAQRLKLKSLQLEREVERIQATRLWRLRRRVAALRPVRALRRTSR
jgi:hypothetical protein